MGKMTGYGSKISLNGDKYTGNFLNDEYHGKGKFFSKDEWVYDGNWNQGKINISRIFLNFRPI